MSSIMSHNEEPRHATQDQEHPISITACKTVTSGPTMEAQIPSPSSSTQDTVTPRRKLTKNKYHFTESHPIQTCSPTPIAAIHPALRPISVFSRHSCSSSTSSTIGQAYDSMSTGSRPSTSWTIGKEYESMRPGIPPNSDWKTGMSYEEMRGNSVAGSEPMQKKRGFLRGYKEELKQNFKAMDRAFSQY